MTQQADSQDEIKNRNNLEIVAKYAENLIRMYNCPYGVFVSLVLNDEEYDKVPVAETSFVCSADDEVHSQKRLNSNVIFIRAKK